MVPIQSLREWCDLPVGSLIGRSEDQHPVRILFRLAPRLPDQEAASRSPPSVVLGEFLAFSTIVDARVGTEIRLFHFAGSDWYRLDPEDVATFGREPVPDVEHPSGLPDRRPEHPFI